MKLGKKYKFIIFSLNDKKTEIVVDKTSTDQDYEKFVEALPENDCRYAIYDYEYEIGNGEGKRSKIIFYIWSPDTAPVRVCTSYFAFHNPLFKSTKENLY